MSKLVFCPECEGPVRPCWTKGRKLRLACRRNAGGDYSVYCEWAGKPYTPERRPIRTVKTVPVDNGAWHYEGFDQYGHTYIFSQAFGSKEACVKAAREDVRKTSESADMGKCVAIVWPPTTTVRGVRVS